MGPLPENENRRSRSSSCREHFTGWGPVIFYPLVLPHEKMGSGSPFAMIRISLLIVLTAFLSTLDRIDDTLLSAHMLEHPAVP